MWNFAPILRLAEHLTSANSAMVAQLQQVTAAALLVPLMRRAFTPAAAPTDVH
jgi:hypothetical protein